MERPPRHHHPRGGRLPGAILATQGHWSRSVQLRRCWSRRSSARSSGGGRMAVSANARPTSRLALPSAGDLALVLLNLLGLVAYLHPFISAGATRDDSRWF